VSAVRLPRALPPRTIIESVAPAVDDGRFPAKRVINDRVEVEADCFAEGHDKLSATLFYRHEADDDWASAPMEALGNDRWRGAFTVDRLGLWRFAVEAGVDMPGEKAAAGPTRTARDYPVSVERERARFSTWYELFPRSCGADPGHGTFSDVAAQLDSIAAMGFDVLYLPPIHPIGRTLRKGRNNVTVSVPGDHGSPWAIGAAEGGHKDIHPELGSPEDLRALVEAASQRGIEVALDIAFQCSPDHPYVDTHPEWFRKNPDGTIRCAENPPKKYEDIYPFDFESAQWRALWRELHGVMAHWASQGVRIFRVDNPHTKPFAFWEWALGQLKKEHPDLIFLSEAFTRPRVMHRLAKIGFSQSYTYFTWRETKHELTEYFTELNTAPGREYFRPNCWPNTPDILPKHLQDAGPPAFRLRLLLAATLAANYGIYGPAFELMENTPRAPGSEEYLHSEKYETKRWDRERPDSLAPFIAQVNGIRREHAALQSDWSLRFHPTDNDSLLCYSKRVEGGNADGDCVLVVANLDTANAQSGWVDLDLADLGLEPTVKFTVRDLLSGASYQWQGPRNYVLLDPAEAPAHVFHLPEAAAPGAMQ
jgi:starch synthase (maltosyl-transferring)